MKKQLTYLLLMSVLLLSGCVNIQKADHTPINDTEFNKPLEQLRGEYSDIELYESVWRGFQPQTLDYNDLVSKWGQPRKEEKLWGKYILGLALNGVLAFGLLNFPIPWFIAINTVFTPVPAESHVWKKGDTRIEAFTRENVINGFSKQFGTWEWRKVQHTKE